MNSLQWKWAILTVCLTRYWFSQAIFVWLQLSQHKFFKRKGRGKKSYPMIFVCVCVSDLDGFIERCDMLKMELR